MTKAKTGETHAKTMVEPVAGTMAGRLAALELALDNLPIAVGLFHIDGRAIYLNAPFRRLHKITEEKPSTYGFAELMDSELVAEWADDPRHFFKHLVSTLKTKGALTSQTEIGGRIIAIHDMLLQGNLILSTQMDVSDRVRAEQQVNYLASHDTLTGLANRVTFNTQLENLIEQKKAMRGRFAVMTIDVDRFKDINDVFGHQIGDAVLTELARRLERFKGPDDFVARLGGDEFAMLSTGNAQPEGVSALATRLLAMAEEEFPCGGQMLKIGLSLGYAVFPQDGQDRASLMSGSDAALYRAKADGRGTVRSFEPEMDKRIHEQRLLQQELRSAIDRNELELRYQPQATIECEIFGFEALLRWHHPTKGLISPDQFIPLAEENGLIIEIGAWTLREACREAASWPEHLRLSVNLSPIQFRHGNLPAFVQDTLRETGLAPQRLELEITEGVLVQDFARALHILRGLKALGVRIAMDDFGTGYSSLSYLQAFPFDTLKIDKSFTSKLWSDHHANEIVRAVIGLGRGLNMPIVAEGVETKEQLEFLRKEQCQSIQGYLIGKPEPIAVYADIVGRPQPAKRPPRDASSRERHRTRVVRAQSI